ncbi:MAG: Crp/Fnr family transcriptional regulator [Elusimicrobiota bacterium]
MKNNKDCQKHDCHAFTKTLFKDLFVDDLCGIFKHNIVNTYERGNVLFYAGNQPLGIYFLCKGQVNIYRADQMGRRQIVRVAKAPDMVGYRAFLSGELYAATAEIMSEAQVCFVDRRTFEADFLSNPRFLRSLTSYLARRLGEAEDKEVSMSRSTVEERLARYLVKIIDAAPVSKTTSVTTIKLPASRSELADFLATTPESVSRSLNALTGRKLIKLLKKNEIVIIDGHRLRFLANR